MLHNTTDKNTNISELRYPDLLKAWEDLPKRSLARRKILTELGLERSYLWRLLNRTKSESPMRKAYETVLRKELGIEMESCS